MGVKRDRDSSGKKGATEMNKKKSGRKCTFVGKHGLLQFSYKGTPSGEQESQEVLESKGSIDAMETRVLEFFKTLLQDIDKVNGLEVTDFGEEVLGEGLELADSSSAGGEDKENEDDEEDDEGESDDSDDDYQAETDDTDDDEEEYEEHVDSMDSVDKVGDHNDGCTE